MSQSLLDRDLCTTVPRAAASASAWRGEGAPLVDVVIPVYNEERDLEPSVLRLVADLRDRFPFAATVTIADNASTDRTWAIAQRLASTVPGVRAIRLDQKGRGRALRAAWLASEAEVLAYMDVDLSTDLDALLPLVAPLISGHSDLAIGSRLAAGARVVRGAKREVISRCYNLLLRLTLGVRFGDAQCGFKAVRADVARRLLPAVENETWFFDTELLVVAQRAGLRIHEVPVDWVEDPDSRVDVVATAIEDLRGILRLRAAGTRRQVWRFCGVGVASSAAYLGLYWVLRGWTPAPVANAGALLVTAIGNTAANRRLTFGIRGRTGLLRDHLGGLVAMGAALLTTNAAIGLLGWLAPQAGRVTELAVLAVANALATLIRFVVLRTWILAVRNPL